jgi:periplasmic protein TonB
VSSSTKIRVTAGVVAVALHVVVGAVVLTRAPEGDGDGVTPRVFDVELISPLPARPEQTPESSASIDALAEAATAARSTAPRAAAAAQATAAPPTFFAPAPTAPPGTAAPSPAPVSGSPSARADGLAREAIPSSAPSRPSGGASEDSYPLIVLRHLERYKRYPSSASARRLEGEAVIELTLDRSGGLRRVRLIRSSGQSVLDEAALTAARAAAPYPRPEAPTWSRRTFQVPLRFEPRRAE